MKTDKIHTLFESARQAPPPEVSAEFAARVMSKAKRLETPARRSVSVSELLSAWFPRLAFAAALAIGVSVALDIAGEKSDSGNLSDNVIQISNEWGLF